MLPLASFFVVSLCSQNFVHPLPWTSMNVAVPLVVVLLTLTFLYACVLRK